MTSRRTNFQSVLTLFLVALMILPLVLDGCGAYYNTFFNARKAFNEAEKDRKRVSVRSRGRGGSAKYNVAIEKSLKVVEEFPNSKYFDDALYVLGVSYYHTGQYLKADRRLRELLLDYPDSDYSKEAKLYLAQTKLNLDDVTDAMELFDEIFKGDYSREIKSDAAYSIASYYYDGGNHAAARPFLLAVRDSLGSEFQQREAQLMIADGEFDGFKFSEALGSYVQALGMDLEKNDFYHALYQSTECSYRLLRVNDGFEYLSQLIEDERFYDSVGSLQLKLGEGYELLDDMESAESIYLNVSANVANRKQKSEALYRLGLIYQFDYDRLEEAMQYYDEALGAGLSGDAKTDAHQRSSDIGKAISYRRAELDTSATLDQIDAAASAQYDLADLYWFQLNKRDSAILEMQYVVDSLPEAYILPKAMIAVSEMQREENGDTALANSLLRRVIYEFPHSDFVSQAIEKLGLSGTAADTGYALYYIRLAEDVLLDEGNVDSARALYQRVVDDFEESDYYLQAQFNLLWLDYEYDHPGDSSVLYAFQTFIDSFPRSPEANVAQSLISSRPRRAAPQETDDQGEIDDRRPGDRGRTEDSLIAGAQDTARGYIDPLIRFYTSPDGVTIPKMEKGPIKIERPFEFPAAGASLPDNRLTIYFQVLLDSFGEVIDFRLMTPTDIEEVDQRMSETVESMTFDGLEMQRLITLNDMQLDSTEKGRWFVYEFNLEKPREYR